MLSSTTYRAAADYVLAHGLARSQFEDSDGKVCTIGALAKAADLPPTVLWGDPVELVPLASLINPLPDATPLEVDYSGPEWVVVFWSDRPERTAEQVAALLRRAADVAERVEQAELAALIAASNLSATEPLGAR